MKIRTTAEWSGIAVGEGEHAIPERCVNALLGVARASGLGGSNGAAVLRRGHNELRAGQVVGLLATDECTLEILPKIGAGEPSTARRQLVHMLGIAVDLPIGAGDLAAVDFQKETLLEIVVRLFSEKLLDAVRGGLPRRYNSFEEDIPTLRGRLDFQKLLTKTIPSSGLLACRYDELSANSPVSQIMRACIERLKRLSQSNTNQRLLSELAFAFADVELVQVNSQLFESVVLDRTNRRWREPLQLAMLLLQNMYQNTSAGRSSGFALLFEMNVLFEQYVARLLARIVGREWTVSAQGGHLYCLADHATGRQSFLTRPDLIIGTRTVRAAVIDTKWKDLRWGAEERKSGVSQGDVYQMMAYGSLYEPGKLVLLYPHHPDLPWSAGVFGHHRINNSQRELLTASLDIESNARAVAGLRSLLEEILPALSGGPRETAAADERAMGETY